MKRRRWFQVVEEVRERCREPDQTTRIMRICNLNTKAFQKLVDQGILVYFDDQRESDRGPAPKRYRVVESKDVGESE